MVACIGKLSPIHTANAMLSSWIASVCTEFATSWRQSRWVWTNLPTRSWVASCRWCECTCRELLWASCELCSHRWCQQDATRQLHQISSVYWILVVWSNKKSNIKRSHTFWETEPSKHNSELQLEAIAQYQYQLCCVKQILVIMSRWLHIFASIWLSQSSPHWTMFKILYK